MLETRTINLDGIIFHINNFKNFGSTSSLKISKLIDIQQLFLQKIFQGGVTQTSCFALFFFIPQISKNFYRRAGLKAKQW
jgi:hypothetical protein